MTAITGGPAHNASYGMNSRQITQTYRWMAPVYDPLFRRFYLRMRAESIGALELTPTDTVALLGVGTGLDLPLLPDVARIVGFDLTRSMLRRATRARCIGPADLILADGARLPLRDASVSVVILHLVLSVAPDPAAVLREASRVLQPGGRTAVLDHFAPAGRPGLLRRVLSRVPRALGTHLDRTFEDMIADTPFSVVNDRRFFRDVYRAVVLVSDGSARAERGEARHVRNQ